MKKSHNQVCDFPRDQVRSAVQQGIAQAEVQMNYKRNSSHRYTFKNGKRKLLYAVSIAVTVFGILIGSTNYFPALASSLSHIPIIGSVFGDSNQIGLQQAQQKGLTSEIGEKQTVNGISVTLDEVLYDQNNITIGLIIESTKKLGEFYFGAGMDFTINGEFPGGSTGTYGEEIQSEATRTAIQGITVTEDMPNAFELGLILHGENGERWYFSTPIKKITDINKIPIQHTEKVDGMKLTITELTLSETGASISYQSSEEGTNFELSRGGNIEFKLVDQNGNEMTSHSGGATGEIVKNRMVFESKRQFDPIGSKVTELTVTPYLALPTEGGGVELDGNGGSRKMELKGKLIRPVAFESFKVKIP